MIAAKHFDPVMGIDIHIIQPPGPVPPIPVPHPFVGMLVDAIEYAPYIGGTVKVNGMMRGVAGTGGKAVPHIPIGGAFVPPIPSNDCTQFMGSQTVAFDADPAARLGDMVLSCQSIGLPPPPRAKPHEKGHSQYLPTSVVLAVPAGPPVLVGGPPTITVMGALKMLGPFIRFVQQSSRFAKYFQAASARLSALVSRLPGPLRWLANKGICFLTGHPVDVASGQVLTEDTDVELPGPLPFTFSRVWYSRSDHRGPLGHGWHHNFDLALTAHPEGIIARLADGRQAAFQAPVPGEPTYNRSEKLFLHLTERGYELEDLNGLTHSFGWATVGGPEVLLDHVRDPNGNRIRLERAGGQLVAFVDSGGRRLPVVTDAAGRITEIRGPNPDKPDDTFPLVSYQYNRDGDLTRVDDAEGHPFRYEYVGHQLLRETNRDGTSFYFMYDGPGLSAKCLRTWGDGDQFLRDLRYDDARQRTEVTDSLGHTTVYEWNDLGAVTKVTDPLGGVTKTEWSPFGDRLSETNAADGKTAFEYDEFGRLTGVTDPAGGSVAVAFDATGNAVSLTDPGGKVWKREYDARRNVVAAVDPLGNRRTFAVDARGLVVSATDPLGHTAHFSWTSAGQVDSGTDRAGRRTAFEYDPLGRVVGRTDPLGRTVRLKYERRGLLTAYTDEGGNTATLRYNAAGNLSATTDPLGRVRSFKYALMGRLAEVRTPVGRVTKNTYDTEGRLVEARDPADRAWRFVRDPNGNVVEEHTPDGRVLRYTRDRVGYITAVRNARGQVTALHRDPTGRLLKRAHADGTADTFKYTAVGMVAAAANAAAEVKLSYDACGRVTEEQVNGRAVRHAYDPAGHRVKRVSPFGRTLHFEYDPEGQVQAVAEGAERLFRSTLDPLGREAERTAGTAVWTWDYLPTGQMAGVTARGRGTNRERRYEYDPAGTPTAQVDSTFGRTEYAHDADGYITGVRHADGSGQEFGYTAGGDIHRPASVGIRRDADGQVVEKTTPAARWEYEYDSFGQLVRAKSAGGLDVRFAYDPFGRRVRKTVGADATEFVWDGDVVLGETGGRTAEYLFRPDTFEPLAVLVSGERPAILDCDPVGLPRTAWHPDGELAWQAAFEPFGEVRGEAGTPGLVPLRYPGQYADAETGLFYNWNRYHDPDQRAYTSPDPLGLYGNGGVWEYVPSPAAWIDPFGLACVDTRINVANGRTRFTPLRANGNPVSAGWNHVVSGHFNPGGSQSKFTMAQNEIKALLQHSDVVRTPVAAIGEGAETQFSRVVDVGHLTNGVPVGLTRVADGANPTTRMRILTDRMGNLITCYPVP